MTRFANNKTRSLRLVTMLKAFAFSCTLGVTLDAVIVNINISIRLYNGSLRQSAK